MLKRLRKKFIVTTMLSVILILTVIMVTVNAVSYLSVLRSSDEVVNLLAQNEGKFPMEPNDNDLPPMEEGPDRKFPSGEGMYDLPKDMSRETPFDTRYFYVICSGTEINEVHLDRIAAISEEDALEMAKSVLSKKRTSGTKGIYRYRKQTLSGGRIMVVFVDISRQLEPMKSFLIVSLIVMSVCIVLLLTAVILLSKPILKPIIDSYSRQKRFITDAGHELKTPLTIISANNEIQEMESGETECTQAIAKQVTRMTTMVKNLTELAKMEEEESLEKKDFSLSDAFLDVTGAFAGVFEKQGKILRVECHREIVYKGTEVLMRRLMTLLMENAAKYSRTFACAELTKKGRRIVMTVKNDAEGIREGDLDKYFERFYRSDEARATQVEGSGIGLSTAKEIVGLHKGKISAKGTAEGEFVITVMF